MKQKKLMLLGGIRYLLPVIEAAHKLGAYVITADYLPDNIAHKYSDEYVNVSIIDRDAVLKVAQEKQIDGILSFGVDPGVVTAAYVAEKMGLPSPPLKSVEILQNKDRFRDFLDANGFNCPWHKGYVSKEEALRDFSRVERVDRVDGMGRFPVIAKPVDSAGSKGCRRIDSFDALSTAIDGAIAESHSGRFIIEQFLELEGHQTGSDCFSIDNELVFCSFDSQYFDMNSPNPYAPIAHIWPCDMPSEAQEKLRDDIQRLIRLLNLGTSIYNIEARVALDGKPYIMEVSPRGGGNRLSEVLKLATGQDLIENNVRMALGLSLLPLAQPKYDGVWVDLVMHSNKTGCFWGIEMCGDKHRYLKEECIYIREGDNVTGFNGANQAIGTMFMQFDTYQEAVTAVLNSSDWLQVKVT
ncbi:MAG: ATP-grasp domain-containing protein [Kiritimatiellae bacterium]|nr:ATP-grasp domain-containing protein [Kiritimatiellia bacterium]